MVNGTTNGERGRIFRGGGAFGTGVLRASSEEYVDEINPNACLEMFGEEVSDGSYPVYESEIVLHGVKQYVDSMAHTNGIEGVRAYL